MAPYAPPLAFCFAPTLLSEYKPIFPLRCFKKDTQNIGPLLPISRQLLTHNLAYKFIQISFKVLTKQTKDAHKCSPMLISDLL